MASNVMTGVPATSASTVRSSRMNRSAPLRSQISTLGWIWRRKRPLSPTSLRRSSPGTSASPIGVGWRFRFRRPRVRGHERENRFDIGYRIERLERRDPLAELAERAGGRKRDEARAAGGAENAFLPVDRLGTARMEVEEIVVEADAAQRDERERAGHGGESDDDPWMPRDPRDEPHGLRPGFMSPRDMPAPRDEHEGGEERHHR